jgi:cold shock CspA family protein|uniref:CSD domain-containing protein n=1 Tax=viral metagenome TaxID=1070528 RepID=A0A6C0M467_9ZZZZ
MSATDDVSSSSCSSSSSSTRLTGRVKWFNNKTGFGFITALGDSDGVKDGSDVFVHHSTIKVANEQYRYLVQGEYVEFVLSKTVDSSKHEYQASDVSGVKGGKLICETRWENRTLAGESESRFKRSSTNEDNGWTTPKRKHAFVPRQNGQWRRNEETADSTGASS